MITMDDNYRFEDFGYICELGNEDPLTPNMEHKTLSISGKIGPWDFGTEIKEKYFSFPLKIMDRFLTRVQYNFNDLKAFLLDPFGKPREIKIVFDYETDKYYIAKLNGFSIPARLTEESTIVVNVVAYDPLKYGTVENHEIHWDSTTVTYDDSYSMDSVYVDNATITAPQIVETTVNGYALMPTILITGTGDNVTLKANGKTLTLGSFSNATYEIRGRDFRIYKNNVEQFINGDFLQLLPGLNQVEITGSNLNFNLSIRVRDQYI